MYGSGSMDRKIASDEHMARHALLFRVIAEEERRKRLERRRRRFLHDAVTAGAHAQLIARTEGNDSLLPDPSAEDSEKLLAQMRAELEASLDWQPPGDEMPRKTQARRTGRRAILLFLGRNRA